MRGFCRLCNFSEIIRKVASRWRGGAIIGFFIVANAFVSSFANEEVAQLLSCQPRVFPTFYFMSEVAIFANFL